MNRVILIITTLLTQACCNTTSHSSHSRYTLYWNEGWGLMRKLDGLSYNECVDLGNKVYTVNGYSCVEEGSRSQCNTNVRVNVTARTRIRL